MKHRTISVVVGLILCLAPAFADTTGSTTSVTVTPQNSLSLTPTTNQNAATSNVSTQINNQNLGANSFGQGITCQAPQVALGGYGARQTTGVGLPNSDSGFSVQYLAPVGAQSTRSCQTLANEVLKQRQLDTQFTMIQKCADFARAGITIDPTIYPELARSCAGIHVTSSPVGSAPSNYPRTNDAVSAPIQRTSALTRHVTVVAIHLSDFSPEHNSELQRIAMHRLQRLASLQGKHPQNAKQRLLLAQTISHETAHLREIIAEYRLENHFLQAIADDHSWRAQADVRSRILSYNHS